MKTFKLFLLFLVFASCSGKSEDEQKILSFLKTKKVELSHSAVVLVNPNFCGSCTQETVDWIIGFDKKFKGQKYLIKTGELDSILKVQLDKTHFQQILGSEVKIQRLGFGGAVSTLLLIENNGIADRKIIKELAL